MKRAADEQVEYVVGGNKYWLSILNKESDSGAFFNERIFFLLEGHHFGYLSEVKKDAALAELNFAKAKCTVLITNLKKIIVKENVFQIKFIRIDDSKVVQRSWIWKCQSNKLAEEWHRKLQYEQGLYKNQKKIQIKDEKKQSSLNKNKLNLQKSFGIIYEGMKIDNNNNSKENKKQYREIGTVTTPKNKEEEQMKKQKQKKQVNIIEIEQKQYKLINQYKQQSQDKRLKNTQQRRNQPIKVKLFNASVEQSMVNMKNEQQSPTSRVLKAKKNTLSNKKYYKVSDSTPLDSYFEQTSKLILESKNNSSSSHIYRPNSSVVKGATMSNSYLMRPQLSPMSFKHDSPQSKPSPISYLHSKGLEFNSDNDQVTWTEKYLLYGQNMYDSFTKYCLNLLHQILCQFSADERQRQYRPKMKNKQLWLYQIAGVQVKLAIMGLIPSKQTQNIVCQFASVKKLNCEYKNYQIINNNLRENGFLRVPLVTLCQLYGFVALFKVCPAFSKKNIPPIEEQLRALPPPNSFLTNAKHIILPLDLTHLPSITKQYQFIQQIDQQQLFHQPPQTKARIEECARQLDNLKTYFISSKEVSEFLHSYHLRVRDLGELYCALKSTFMRNVMMSEVAARCCKHLFRKTLQDLAFDKSTEETSFLQKVIDFLNLVVGTGQETVALWKLLSAQSMASFAMPLSTEQLQKGYFVIALAANCRLNLDWAKIHPANAFKVNPFFSQSNVLGIHGKSKVYKYKLNTIVQEVISKEVTEQGFDCIMRTIGLMEEQEGGKHISNERVRKYISNFISLEDDNYNLYNQQYSPPSAASFYLQQIGIKWALKKGDAYIKLFNNYLSRISKYFGEFHPLQVDLYELFSTYHLHQQEYEDAITFQKSALVSLLKICGSVHPRNAEAYYNLALCCTKADRNQEAIAHLKKAHFILEQVADTKCYSLLTLKLSTLYLHQNHYQQCIHYANIALEHSTNAQECTQTLEILYRCTLLMGESAKHLLEPIQQHMEKCEGAALVERLLKLYVAIFIREAASSKTISSIADIVTLIPIQHHQRGYTVAYDKIKERINQKTLTNSFVNYISNINSINQYVGEKGLLRQWRNLQDNYARDTVHDCLCLFQELIYMLGQTYILSVINQVCKQ